MGSLHHDERVFTNVEEYVNFLGGNKPITKVLIANSGMAAVKAIRSFRKWAYEIFGNERVIEFIAMATPEDLKANAEYIRMSDSFCEVPGGSNNNNYANVEIIVDVAERTGAHAVWAGWGHASENPRLPDALSCTLQGILFIGPPSIAMRDLGDKIASTIVAQSAHVKCVPWSGEGLTVEYAKTGVPESVLKKASVQTVEEAIKAAEKIGFPVMVKASEGGGGKGIRKVTGMEELASAFRGVSSEVPGSPIFLMRLVPNARHLEVQILADQHGQAISLYGRDCSVQRRHQKIMEEGPTIAAADDVWEEMEKAAVRLVKEVGYVGAGTVEYLFRDGDYYFLELNPRLQVEHPVTEEITGVNLPASQLQVAMGIPLHRIPEIRKLYGLEPYGTTPIDFYNAKRLPPKGHVIAVRITGENPDEGFKPTSGDIHELTFRSTPNVWGYFSVGARGGLHEYADSQFGHIFARGTTREGARRSMVLGLKEISIRGDIRTPVEYVIHLLETDDYKKNKIHTGWLDNLIALRIVTSKPDIMVAVLCGALYKAHQHCQASIDEYNLQLSRGQVPSSALLNTTMSIELIYLNTKYKFLVSRSGPTHYSLSLQHSVNKQDSKVVEAQARNISDGGLLVLLDGKMHVCYGKEDVTGLRLTVDSKTCLFPREYDPTNLRATSPGKLVRYLVSNGSHIDRGTPYCEMEIMKMYMPLIAPESGRIFHVLQEGCPMATGDLIATLELDDPSTVMRPIVYEGSLPPLKPPSVVGEKPHQKLRTTITIMNRILDGYDNQRIKDTVEEFMHQVLHPKLPALEFGEILSRIGSRIPKIVTDGVTEEMKQYEASFVYFPQIQIHAEKIEGLLDQAISSSPDLERKVVSNNLQPLQDLVVQYKLGMNGYATKLINDFLEQYLHVERHFQGKNMQTAMVEIKERYKNDLAKVINVSLAHFAPSHRQQLVLTLLEKIEQTNQVEYFIPMLNEMSNLSGRSIDVSLKAKQLLIRYQLPSLKQRSLAVEEVLKNIITSEIPEDKIKMKQNMIDQSTDLFDILLTFFKHTDPEVQALAAEVYVRRAYKTYYIDSLRVGGKNSWSPLHVEWYFKANSKPNSFFSRTDSMDSLVQIEENAKSRTMRYGMLVYLNDNSELESVFSQVLNNYNPAHFQRANSPPITPITLSPTLSGSGGLSLSGSTGINSDSSSGNINILQVVTLKAPQSIAEEQELIQSYSTFLKEHSKQLTKAGIKRVTFVCGKAGSQPKYYTFREGHNFEEDPIFRHIEPAMAGNLEIRRLANFDIQQHPTENQHLHLYFAEEKGRRAFPDCHRCFFVRALVRQGDMFSYSEGRVIDILVSEVDRLLSEALDALEVAMGLPQFSLAQNHHIFLNVLPEVSVDERRLAPVIQRLGKRYGRKMWKLKVRQAEIRLKLRRDPPLNPVPLRFFVSNPSGFAFRTNHYFESQTTNGMILVALPGTPPGPLDGKPVDSPYEVMDVLQRKRFQAQHLNTTYVYDFLDLFKEGLQQIWAKHLEDHQVSGVHPPLGDVFRTTELVLSAEQENITPEMVTLQETNRPIGKNTIGMIAWRATLITPEYPEGRDIIIIANDITHQIGSFGLLEDVLFQKASELARKEGIPRIYLSANSGARFGFSDEVKDKFKVMWNFQGDQSKGIKYLYVEEADYRTLEKTNSVKAVKSSEFDHWIITDIIGASHGIGVENLSGSGLLAGETSLAYKETFTISLVTGRTVGIGAYLIRLGQRTVQNEGPIILTGAGALNKVLGKEVYDSNHQIGGPQIMYANGVSHLAVNDELSGVIAILNWISFVPKKRGALVPIIKPFDPVDRLIEFSPFFVNNVKYDIRDLLVGYQTNVGSDRKFISGLFDKGSFIETLGGWAKSVVIGRARLGGIPLGVIAVETKTVEKVVPADPANPESHEVKTQQAASVWFPDSSFKTAQAIIDFNNEEIPLFILANWRGFSGGMRDMFDEILKFGSYIVDNLREFNQPIIIYIPPEGELRGGAWVVLDTAINPQMIEMYASDTSRGGVLEPTGAVEIKYRDRDVIKTMHRLDQRLITLDKELKESPSLASPQIKQLITQREKELLPFYQQMCIKFADLHDTPGRMKLKGVIREIVPWTKARQYFYYRLYRRLLEEQVKKRIKAVHPGLEYSKYTHVLKGWFLERGGESLDVWNNDDRRVLSWLQNESNLIDQKVQQLRKSWLKTQVVNLAKEDPNTVIDGLLDLLNDLPTESKTSIVRKLLADAGLQ